MPTPDPGDAPQPDAFAVPEDWEAAAPSDPSARAHDFAGSFRDAARRARARGAEREARTFDIIADACSLVSRLRRRSHAFQPLAVSEGFRTPGLDDMDPNGVELLGRLAVSATRPVLRARLGDVAWSARHDVAAARAASSGYLALAEVLETDVGEWPQALPHLERALQIGVKLGPRNAEFGTARDAATRALDASAGHAGLAAAKLAELLLDYRAAEPAALLELLFAGAGRAEARGEWREARIYWDVAADCAGAARLADRRADAQRRLAEAYASEAEAAAAHGGGGLLRAPHLLQQAVETLRRVGGEARRVDELHARMLVLQREAHALMVPLSTTVDGSAEAERVESAVSGLPLELAIVALAAQPLLPSETRLREQVERNASRSILAGLFPRLMLSREGKFVARQPSLGSTDADERAAAVEAEMMQYALLHYQVCAAASVETGRRRIVLEHALTEGDLLVFAANNPLVPPGREGLWARGLHAGLVGDTAVAIHLLIPQLEHSLRVLLTAQGLLVSSLDREGVQLERNLNTFLAPAYREHLVRLFGDDVVFSLRTLLVERFGANLRNETAHGLMDDGEFYGPNATFLWWLLLRYCCLPALGRLRDASTPPGPAPEGPLRGPEDPDLAAPDGAGP